MPPDEEPTPSTSVESPESIEPGQYGEFSIDSGEDHYFDVNSGDNEQLTTSIEYASAEGPIGLTVLGPAGDVLAESETDDDGETITVTVDEWELYVINPFSRADEATTYELEITFD